MTPLCTTEFCQGTIFSKKNVSFDITLIITLCGQINDLGQEVKMMKLVFVSFVNTQMTENYRGTK